MSPNLPNVPSENILPHVAQYFNKIPWCAETLSDPSLVPIPLSITSRISNDTKHLFFGKTLATNETIIAYQPFYNYQKANAKIGSTSHDATSSTILSSKDPNGALATGVRLDVEKVTVLLSIGSGVNGHFNVAHGGFVSAVLDDTMSLIPCLRSEIEPHTASLEIRYHKPVPTPGVVRCRSWLTRQEGRKIWLSSTLEDGQGTQFASGKSLFVYGNAKI